MTDSPHGTPGPVGRLAQTVRGLFVRRPGHRQDAPDPPTAASGPRTGEEARYQSIVFLNAVVPVLKPIIAATPALARAFAGLNGVVQISALDEAAPQAGGGAGERPARMATHLVVDDGAVSVVLGAHGAPNLELEFGSLAKLNAFFTGSPALPRFRGGWANRRLLVATVRSLLTMSKLLGATTPPERPEDQRLLTQCMFYLLTSGISQLNRAGHPRLRKWSSWQPDRVYQLEVDGQADLAAFVRVKGGRTRSARGRYTRSRPFFTMAFDSPRSALGILLDVDDMIESTVSSKIMMRGAPEYGAELGELMQLVGDYAK